MKRRAFLTSVPAAMTIARLAAQGNGSDELLEKAKALHEKITAFDSHVDLPFDFAGAAEDGKSQIDLPKVARGQLKGAALAVFVPQGARTPEGYAKAREDADKKYAFIKDFAEKNPDKAEIAYSPSNVRKISSRGKFAVVISVLNAYPLMDVAQIDAWYKRGVRILGYTHAGHNQWSDSSRPSANLKDKPEEHGGLSGIGKQGIARLNELGIVIDVSQITTPAFKQVLSLTKAPVVASHSGVKGIIDASRNLSDEELELLKKNGGVIQIVAFSNYLRKGGEGAPPATVPQYVDAIEYAVKRIGADHVGIASDFNHGGGVTGWQNEGECQNVTAELLKRAYSEKDIAKLWGGNFFRVWDQALKIGKRA